MIRSAKTTANVLEIGMSYLFRTKCALINSPILPGLTLITNPDKKIRSESDIFILEEFKR